jgi:hypothetical protein
MSTFEPKTEQEINSMMVFPAGEYDFEVEDAVWGESKKGKAMITLTIRVFDEQGRNQLVRDWLVASPEPMPLRKLRHYCAATDRMDAYESGDLNNFPGQGAAGRLNLGVETSDQYGDQNRVVDYVDPSKGSKEPKREPTGVPPAQAKRAREATQADDPADDEIPF